MTDATVSKESTPTPTAIWSPLPKQPKQTRCRQNFAHTKPKRTFYWIIESTGPICQQCVNVRETRKAFPATSEGVAAGDGTAGKFKKRKSTIAPSIKNAIIAKRFSGESKLQIAKDVHVAPGTVRNVLKEAEVIAPPPCQPTASSNRRTKEGILPRVRERRVAGSLRE